MLRSLWNTQFAVLFLLGIAATANAQHLQQSLLAEGVGPLATAAQGEGDAKRGAILFHQQYLGCAKCHDHAAREDKDVASVGLGPDLTTGDHNVSVEQIVES